MANAIGCPQVAAGPQAATGYGRAALTVLSVAQFLVALDYSVVYVALPSITRDLSLDTANGQWVISAYALFFAGFLMLGGRLADRYGAGRLFVVAVLLFGLFSAVGGAAPDGVTLLAARAAQGFAAALLQPAVLGLIATVFPAGPARGRAVAVWGSVGAAGLAAGAILGGLLSTASWRLIFLVNVPLAVACAVTAARWPQTRKSDGGTGRIPLLASILGTGTVLALVAGLTLGTDQGWQSVPTLGCLGSAALLLVAFLHNERVSGSVLVDRVLRRTRSLRVGALATALYMASVGSEFYLVTLLFQSAKGYPPLRAGLAFLPLAVLVTAGSATAGWAVRRLPAAVLASGFGIAATGLGWLALARTGDSYLVDLPGLLLSGFGHGVIYTSMFTLGTRDVPVARHGVAGALLTTSQYLAGAVTIAVLTLVLDGTGFRAAFGVTTAAAAAGLILGCLTGRRSGTMAG